MRMFFYYKEVTVNESAWNRETAKTENDARKLEIEKSTKSLEALMNEETDKLRKALKILSGNLVFSEILSGNLVFSENIIRELGIFWKYYQGTWYFLKYYQGTWYFQKYYQGTWYFLKILLGNLVFPKRSVEWW